MKYFGQNLIILVIVNRERLDVLRCQIEFIFACHWHQKEDVKMLHKKQKTWHIWLQISHDLVNETFFC
jgi:hypothetical protein